MVRSKRYTYANRMPTSANLENFRGFPVSRSSASAGGLRVSWVRFERIATENRGCGWGGRYCRHKSTLSQTRLQVTTRNYLVYRNLGARFTWVSLAGLRWFRWRFAGGFALAGCGFRADILVAKGYPIAYYPLVGNRCRKQPQPSKRKPRHDTGKSRQDHS